MSLGEQVFREFRLGEVVLVRGDWSRALRSRRPTGHADLRVPHRSELVRPRRSRRRRFAFADLARGGFACNGLARRCLARGDFARRCLARRGFARFAERLARSAVASAATTAASPTATRGIDILSALGGLNVGDFARSRFARNDLVCTSLIGKLFTRSLTGVGGSGELLTAGDRDVKVAVRDSGRDRIKRTYLAPRLNDVDLLSLSIQENAADPVSVQALAMVHRLLGAESGSRKGAEGGWSRRTSIRSQEDD
jgi:hypothetical protein